MNLTKAPHRDKVPYPVRPDDVNLPLRLGVLVAYRGPWQDSDAPDSYHLEGEIEVWCDHCADWHRHGWSLGGVSTRTEQRCRHCTQPNGPQEYLIGVHPLGQHRIPTQGTPRGSYEQMRRLRDASQR